VDKLEHEERDAKRRQDLRLGKMGLEAREPTAWAARLKMNRVYL
jgi:hypothetical protein